MKNVGRLVIRNNLFYGAITQHTPFITYEAGCVPSSGEIIDNLGYNTNGTGTPYWKVVNNSFLFPGSREFTMTKENPFDGGRFDTATGVFVPGTAYASYGARR